MAAIRAVLEHGLLLWAEQGAPGRLVRIETWSRMGDGGGRSSWLAPHFVGLDMGGVRLSWHRQRRLDLRAPSEPRARTG